MKKAKLIILVLAILVVGGVFIYGDIDGGHQAQVGSAFDEVDKEIEEKVPEKVEEESEEEEIKINEEDITMKQATLKTNKGEIVLEFYPELAPNTVKNFQDLVEKGFYDGVIFHRVIKNFMIQGGDPTGTGMGGPGYKFNDELDPSSDIAQRGYVRGTLAMANSGPNTNGSQFFIMHQDYPLPYQYTVFGRVVEGMDIVDIIATTETAPGDRPVEDVVIEEVVILGE